MNNERMTFLLTYLDGLAKLSASEFKCSAEILACLGMIREEFAKAPKDVFEVNVDGEVFYE